VELILVVFGLLAISIPFATAYLLWRVAELRRRLLKLTELTMELNDALRRDLMELKRQVAASPGAAEAAVKAHPAPQPAAPVTPPPIEKPAATIVPTAAKPAEPATIPTQPSVAMEQKPAVAVEKREAEMAPISGPVFSQAPPPAKPLPPAEQKPTPAVPVADRKPVPAPPATPAPPKPPAPAVPTHEPEPAPPPPSVTPPPRSPREAPCTPPPPLPPHPGSTPPHTPSAPPPGARVVAPPQFAALRTSAPKPTAHQRMKSVLSFEEILGTNWLNRIGITLIVLGVASFGIYELGRLGPLGKVALSYSLSIAFLVGGIFLEKRDRYRILSYALIGGGWALLFFSTYALNHVPAMRVLSSETTDLILMLAVALAMVVHTLRYRSQVVTGLAFLLAYSTVALSHDDVYSLSSGAILAVGLVSIVIKMGWFELEVFGILSSYLNHGYWLYRLLGPEGASGQVFPEYHASTALLLFYWLTYRVSYVVRKTKSPREEHVSTAAALLNTLLLLGTMKFQSVRPELAFWALLVIGAVEFTLAQLPITKRRREAFVVLSVLGAALMIASVPFRYSGNDVAILWLIGAEALLAAGVVASEVVFRRLGLFGGLLVGLHLFRTDLPQLMAARRTGEELVLSAGIMFALCAVVFYVNSLFVGSRWSRFFGGSPDTQLLTIHSYLGGFAALSAAWALGSGDWTVLGFAGIVLSLAFLGKNLKSRHLQLQYGTIGLLSLYRVFVFNLHTDVPQFTHVSTRLITVPIVAVAFYLTAKWAAHSDEPEERMFRGMFALAGTLLVTALIYFEVPELWQPLAAIAFAVLLLEVGRWVAYDELAWHAHLLTGLAVVAAITADQMGAQRWHDIPLHAFGALPVVAGAYWIAYRIRVSNAAHAKMARGGHSWVGSGLMVWVLYEAVPEPWIAVAWILFAIALALAIRQIKYNPLAWQANAVAACSVVRAYTYDMQHAQLFWQEVSLRMVTIAIVAAGLYFLSRLASVPDSPSRRAVSYLHTTAATALLALLAWYEAPGGWLAAVWAVFALVLALVDRRFGVEELAWQAHALAALTMMRAVSVNLYIVETWHGISVRLLSLAVVTVVLYSLSRIIRMPGEWRRREFHHIYSWAASALVAGLMWYELQPLSVAVGWAVFGLVLFEYGLWRQTRQFRMQAYVALSASFGRIFFANLTAGTPGEFWGPRIYTVLPITLILFFVYAQLGPADQIAKDDRRMRLDMILAYLGTGTVVALLYFQYPNDWLVAAWAVVVFVLMGLALVLNRPIFLHQGLFLTLGACTRGVMHNLFGSSYFTGGEWIGKYGRLGSGIALFFACLPFAFRLRDRYKKRPSTGRIAALARRPEQFMFFAPVLLLTIMLALKMRAGMITVSWGIESLSILIFAFVINERSFRLTGLLLLLVSFGKILFIDMWSRTWSWPDRYITFLIVGAAMFLASFLYTKYSDKIRQFL
jgi:hypothetical protein